MDPVFIAQIALVLVVFHALLLYAFSVGVFGVRS